MTNQPRLHRQAERPPRASTQEGDAPTGTGRKPQLQGIEVRHQKACRTCADNEARCNCHPSYRPYVYDAETRKPRKGRWVKSLAEARSWRTRTLNAIATGTLGSASSIKLREAGDDLIAGMESGDIR